MSMNASGNGGRVSEINVTPLIDVLLVLLIIFMVIVPVAPKGMAAEALQPSKHEEPQGPSDPIVVSVIADTNGIATYKINSTPFAKDAIGSKLAEIYATRAEKQMFLKGDKNLDFTTVAAVIDDAHRAGVDQIGIITPGGVKRGGELRAGQIDLARPLSIQLLRNKALDALSGASSTKR